MPIKDPVKRKEYDRLYYIKNKERIKEEKKEYDKEYKQTENGKKVNRISRWISRGILCFDFDLLYDIFVKTTNCEFCNCELNTDSRNRKCLDHNHNITDRFNVRGVLCNSCNIKDVLKD